MANESTPEKPAAVWYVYLLECVDGSIYTGIAIDVMKRYAQHAAGKGARYTRSRPPKRLLAAIEYPDRSNALKAEYAIKQLSAAAKRKLAQANTLPDAWQHALHIVHERDVATD